MKQVTMLAAFLFIGSITSFSQEKKSYLEICLNGGIPTGSEAKAYSFGAGAAFRYVHFFKPTNGWFDFSDIMPYTLSAGVYNIFNKDTSSSGAGIKAKNILLVPLMIGSKFHIEKHKYMAIEAGWSLLKSKESSGSFSFTFEAGLDFNKFCLALRFLGVAGKNEYFVGLGSLQLSFKI